MNLRKRSNNSTDSVRTEKKHKSGIVRRSERIKNDEKAESDPNKASKKDKHKKIKKKYSQKKKKTTDNDDSDETDSETLFPGVLETGAKDLLEEVDRIRSEELPMLKEAGVLFECRACKGFFRVFSTFIKHKQSFCPNSPGKGPSGSWNPFLDKEVFDLMPGSDCSEGSEAGSEEDSAFEDGPSSSPKNSDGD